MMKQFRRSQFKAIEEAGFRGELTVNFTFNRCIITSFGYQLFMCHVFINTASNNVLDIP